MPSIHCLFTIHLLPIYDPSATTYPPATLYLPSTYQLPLCDLSITYRLPIHYLSTNDIYYLSTTYLLHIYHLANTNRIPIHYPPPIYPSISPLHFLLTIHHSSDTYLLPLFYLSTACRLVNYDLSSPYPLNSDHLFGIYRRPLYFPSNSYLLRAHDYMTDHLSPMTYHL